MLLPPPVQKSIFLSPLPPHPVLVPRPFVAPPHPSFSSSIANLSANLWQGNDIIRRLNSSSHTGPPSSFRSVQINGLQRDTFLPFIDMLKVETKSPLSLVSLIYSFVYHTPTHTCICASVPNVYILLQVALLWFDVFFTSWMPRSLSQSCL